MELPSSTPNVHVEFWSKIQALTCPLYFIVNAPPIAAHILGQAQLKRVDEQDVLYLGESGTHLHLHWDEVQGFEHRPRVDYDRIVMIGTRGPSLELVPSDPSFRFSEEILQHCRG